MRLIFLVLPFWFFSCAVLKERGSESSRELSVEELFLLLPDEAFYVEDNRLVFTGEERKSILAATTAAQAAAASLNFFTDTIQSTKTYLELRTINDDGILVSLKTWEHKDKSVLVGVNISVGDMCCSFSRLALFQYAASAFAEQTDDVFPKLTIEDFTSAAVDAKVKALLPSPIELNVYTFPHSDTIELSIDYTPMVYDLVTFHELEDRIKLKEERLKLIWRGRRFVVQDE